MVTFGRFSVLRGGGCACGKHGGDGYLEVLLGWCVCSWCICTGWEMGLWFEFLLALQFSGIPSSIYSASFPKMSKRLYISICKIFPTMYPDHPQNKRVHGHLPK